MIPSTALHLAVVGEKRGYRCIVECWRTAVIDRFVCLDRWPSEPSRWCHGCGRMARVAERLNAPSRTSVRGKLRAENERRRDRANGSRRLRPTPVEEASSDGD